MNSVDEGIKRACADFGVSTLDDILASDFPKEDIQTLLELGIADYPDRVYVEGDAGDRFFQPEFMRRYDLSTLMYLFYYGPNESRRFVAAEMHRRGWCFHSNLRQWMRRDGEILSKTRDAETAVFEYFDAVTAWSVRPKGEFTFRYEFQR